MWPFGANNSLQTHLSERQKSPLRQLSKEMLAGIFTALAHRRWMDRGDLLIAGREEFEKSQKVVSKD